MKAIWERLRALRPLTAASETVNPASPQSSAEDALWRSVYSSRESYYRANFGELPDNILKVAHLFGVWPGGGLFVIPANRIASGIWTYTTFGFSNPGMPPGVAVSDIKIEHDDLGRLKNVGATLQKKARATTAQGTAGYGYELVVLATEEAEWPLGILQWVTTAELLNDAGLLKRVEEYKGLTVEGIKVGEDEEIDLLIARAQPPLPIGATLPNGKMEILIATTITTDEMKWSMEHGRDALLKRLVEAGVGQISRKNRKSILH